MDELLIKNYEEFKSLGSDECYSILSSIVGIPEDQCRARGRALKLSEDSAEKARQLSRKLVNQQTMSMTGKKMKAAMKKFIGDKMGDLAAESIQVSMIKEHVDYIQGIFDDYKDYREEEDNLILFGGNLELEDIKREAQNSSTSASVDSTLMKVPFVVVPVDLNDFNKLSDIRFLRLLASFGIKVGQSVFPRIEASVTIEQFKEALK